MHTRSFIFFTRILARAQISSLTSEGFFIEVLSVTILETTKTWEEVRLEKNRFYRSQFWRLQKPSIDALTSFLGFYRSQFWRLQKLAVTTAIVNCSFIGHNFGDYKNSTKSVISNSAVLSVTILETTKTSNGIS